MNNESIGPAATVQHDELAWQKFSADVGLGTKPSGLRSKRWFRALIGAVSVIGMLAVIIATVLFLGYKLGTRNPAPAKSAAFDRVDGVPAAELKSTTVFTAPSSESLRVPILNGSTAILAPGARLTITPRPATTAPGALADAGTLSGAARFEINKDSKRLTLRTAAGIAVLEQGITEITVLRDTLIARAITGAVFVRPGGRWSFKSVHVLPGHEVHAPVGGFVTGRSIKPIGGK